jgi:capsular polysaccharide biosynthesis protein
MAAPQNFVSVSRRPPDVEDYIDILRRYRSWIVGPTFAGLVIAVVVACWLPDVYMCTASMQIKPGAVPNDLIPAAMTGQMAQRMQQLDREILGRDNLITLIRMPSLDLYKKERARYSDEDVAQDVFAKHVHIQPIVSDGERSGAQAFRIVFEYPDKYRARKVVLELVNEFQSKNAVLQSTNAGTAATLMDDLVKGAREKWAKAQTEIANFSSQNQGRLPENFQANMLEVQTKDAMIANVNQQIGQEKQKQALLESSLSNNKNMQSQSEMNLNSMLTTTNSAVKNQNLINLQSAINTKSGECTALQRKYQPEFPTVQTCQEVLHGLEEQRDGIEKSEAEAGQPGSTSRMVQNPQVAQQLQNLRRDESDLVAQIKASLVQEGVLTKQAADLSRQLKEAQDKITASPPIIQQYSALSQDLQMAKDEYQSLSAKKETTGTQQTMEEHRAGETLDLLEQPLTPETPYSPNRPAIVGIGTALGLVLGVALAGAKEIKNTSLKNLKDVRAYTNLPVLSSIPLLENALLVRRKRRMAWLAWSSALIVGAGLMSGAAYYYFVIAAQQVT